jgi:hypothetical protein
MAEAGAGLLAGLGIGLGYGVVSDYARLGALWAKWGVMNALKPDFVKDAFAKTMQSILSAEKDPVSGLSSKGTVDVMWEFVGRTIDMSIMINENIATQMFIQMLQQSIAYAIHSSHAGAIGTLGNVYSGSTYLSPTESSYIAEESDRIDRDMKAFLSAEVGQNIPTLAFSLTRGANRQVSSATQSLMRNVDTLLDEWNDLALSYYRHYHSMARERLGSALRMKETAVDRAYGLLEQVGNEHLARLSEQLDTLTGAKAWFDAGLMSEDDLKEIAIRIDLERNASEGNYDVYKTDIVSAIADTITTWDAKITQALGDLTDTEDKYNALFTNMFTVILTDVSNIIDAVAYHCETILGDVCAYRNIDNFFTYEAVTGIPDNPEGETEFIYDDSVIVQVPTGGGTFISIPFPDFYVTIEHTVPVMLPTGIVSFLDTIIGEAYDETLIADNKFIILSVGGVGYIGYILGEVLNSIYGETETASPFIEVIPSGTLDGVYGESNINVTTFT